MMDTKSTGRAAKEKKMTTLTILTDYYLADLSLKNRSRDTIACNGGWLRRFDQFLQARGHSRVLKDLSAEDAQAYVVDLQARDARWKGHPVIPPQAVHP
ncbi:MAG: hypothetical protein HY260_08120, partial [Chloroflexi bacterium]|nr:hypothetical protein [Chloroflexota bacterium]